MKLTNITVQHCILLVFCDFLSLLRQYSDNADVHDTDKSFADGHCTKNNGLMRGIKTQNITQTKEKTILWNSASWPDTFDPTAILS